MQRRGQNSELTKKNQPYQCVTSSSDCDRGTLAVSGVSELGVIALAILAGVVGAGHHPIRMTARGRGGVRLPGRALAGALARPGDDQHSGAAPSATDPR